MLVQIQHPVCNVPLTVLYVKMLLLVLHVIKAMYLMEAPVMHPVVPVFHHFVQSVPMGYVSNVHMVSMLIQMGSVLKEQACFAIQHMVLIIQTVKPIFTDAQNMP